MNGRMSRGQFDVGYCPQMNALDGFMTGRSLLTFYCNLKGIANVHKAYASTCS